MHGKCRIAGSMWLVIALVLSVIALCVPTSAQTAEFPDTPEAKAVYFYHMESRRCIGAKAEKQILPAGSTLKIVSGLIACERLEGQLQDEIVITEDMLRNSSGYRYRMKAGEIYTVEQLLYLAVCGSYNDAFDVLAYLIGEGDTQAFVAMMNQKAAELGAADTAATDPTGIGDNSLTTAEDLFRISLAASENTLYMQICGSEFYDLPDKRIYNRNALISSAADTRYYNSKCSGMSAGTTQLGGASVITLAQSGNDRYLCVVLGAAEEEGDNGEVYSYVVANRLIQWGYENYTYLEVLSPDTVICSIPVTVSDLTDTVDVSPAESLFLYLPSQTELGRDVTFSIRLMYEALEAPVHEGMHVGYVAVVYQGEILGTASLFTVGSAERSSFVSQLMKIQSLTQSRKVRAGGIFFLAATAGWLLTGFFLQRRRRHKWDKYFSHKIDMPETLLKRREPPRGRSGGRK